MERDREPIAARGDGPAVLACALSLALFAPPSLEAPPPPEPPGSLPHWQRAPEPRDPSQAEPEPEQAEPKPPPKVPYTGAGLIALGSVALATGVALEAGAITFGVRDGELAGPTALLFGGYGVMALGSGTALVTVGALLRRKFQASPAAAIPDAPPTGSAMIYLGAPLFVAGAVLSSYTIVNLASILCTRDGSCEPYRPRGVWVRLGVGLGAFVLGSGLVITGGLRRAGYARWSDRRKASAASTPRLWPSFAAGPRGLQLGVAGRF